MLSWLFKKRVGVAAPKEAISPQPNPQAQADTKARQADDAKALWRPRLQSAQGDDAALLGVAQAAPLLEIKLAAVEALASEEALKQAERAFRSHDRKVHGLAKRRLVAAAAQREARARATQLIATASAWAGEALLPANRLVELDRDWQSLDANLLDAAQCSEFAALRDRLGAALRERGEAEQRAKRWSADANRALDALQVGCAEAAAAGSAAGLAAHCQAAQALCDARPDEPATAALADALQAALQTAARVDARLAFLDALDHPAAEPEPSASPAVEPQQVSGDEAVEPPTGEPPPTAAIDDLPPAPPAPTAAQRWRELEPLADAELARVLNDRFERWQRRQLSARRAAPVPRAVPAVATPPRPEQLLRLDALLRLAEAALAEGQTGPMQRHLQAVDAAFEAINGNGHDDALRARHQALHAERARLKGWQQWGGGLARDGLTNEAEELARLTLAAADPEAIGTAKLHLKAHGEAIHSLRLRWKELDRLGASASQAQWQRFDGALQAAYQPVAAQQAALKAARHDNLAAREALLDALDAAAVDAPSANTDDMAAHWKEQLSALERFHLAWRQLGPLEHTVPAGARSGLQRRVRGSVERIEAPLQEARRAAEAAREQLIVRAEALLQGPAPDPQLRDAVAQVRDLQAQWQQHARTVPLPRALEAALWARFKAATDAVFARRDAAFGARDAELAANLAAREALLERLTALDGDTPVAEMQRTLAEVDRAWRQPVELPRGAAGALDARLRDAHAAALKLLADGARARWQAQCDALAATLERCEAREDGIAGAGADDAPQPALPGELPPAWAQALAERCARPAEAGPLAGAALEDLLLQLEAALDLPATAEQQAARRDLKLRAMKDALEGRAASNPGSTRGTDALPAALCQGRLTSVQRERLRALIAALRRAAPGTLVVPAPRG